MKKNIGLETRSNPLSETPIIMSSVRNDLESEINKLFEKNDYGGASISELFTTIIRVYDKINYDLQPLYYKPIARKGRNKNTVLITQDIYLEEIEGQDKKYIYNRFLDCVIASVNKLSEIKIKDVKIDLLNTALERLKKV